VSSLGAAVEVVDDGTGPAPFCASGPVTLLEHFRVPYRVDGARAADDVEQLRVPDGGPSLLWKRPDLAPAASAFVLGVDRQTPIPLFATVHGDEVVEPLLAPRGGTWHRIRELTGDDGAPLGSIWREEGGSVFLPFDPNEVIENYWSERYLQASPGCRTRGLRRMLMRAYYRIRPLLPRSVQIWSRRRFAFIQSRSSFPRWPVETCLHDFFDLMFAILADVAGAPIPYIAPWPKDYDWALVLTHDVEQAAGLLAMDPVLEVEQAHGLRSAWNLVPRRYDIDLERVLSLTTRGFEVGVHGLYHDGRDLESPSTWSRRLPEAHDAAALWGATGFRSAALHRDWDMMRQLELDYDTSYPDTDPFEPQDGGCCTWLPFFNGEMVELPLTLPQDHTLFVILGQHDETAWVDKAEFLRARGGLAVIDTHPDYLIDERIFTAYVRFLDRFADDVTAWHVLPREVSAWWRRRAASSLEYDEGSWRVVGPAAGEARVRFGGGAW
jgi:hypothetical protein